ncbi:hypothetical protein DFS33DRAFT_1387018 [Desarmillaria ectypa]|nr:hypothetical protein DFS33DRAFT_1387018 [Desarmillaria ectypa]
MSTTLPGHQVLSLELINRITDEVYNYSDTRRKDLYNMSLTSRELSSMETLRSQILTMINDVSKIRVLFESNRNPAILVRILILDDAEQSANISSPNLLFVLGEMRNLNVIKLNGVTSRSPRRGRVQLPFFAAFANHANLTDMCLYDMSMKYGEFETILRSNLALTSLLIPNLDIDGFEELLPRIGYFSIVGVLNEPQAVAWEDPQSPHHRLQPTTDLNLPIERLIVKLVTPSDYKIMDLLASSRLPILLPGSPKRLAISTATGALNKVIVDIIIAFLDSPLTQSVGIIDRSGTHAPRNLDTVRLPLCTVLALHFVINDWSSTGEGPCWFCSILETLSPEQLPITKLLLVFDFHFENDCIDNMPTPDHFWPRLDNALSANGLVLEEIGVHIVLRVEDPECLFLDLDEESGAEQSDGSESGLEENEEDRGIEGSWVGSGEEVSDMKSDPDDSSYITDQREYTEAEIDEDDVELEKKDEHDEDEKSQDDKEVHPWANAITLAARMCPSQDKHPLSSSRWENQLFWPGGQYQNLDPSFRKNQRTRAHVRYRRGFTEVVPRSIFFPS